jgi:hypothetical protein
MVGYLVFQDLDTIVLKAPANNATNQQIDLTLSWDAANGVTKYDYEISTNPEFEEPLHLLQIKLVLLLRELLLEGNIIGE